MNYSLFCENFLKRVTNFLIRFLVRGRGIHPNDSNHYKCLFTGTVSSSSGKTVGMASLSNCFHDIGFVIFCNFLIPFLIDCLCLMVSNEIIGRTAVS